MWKNPTVAIVIPLFVTSFATVPSFPFVASARSIVTTFAFQRRRVATVIRPRAHSALNLSPVSPTAVRSGVCGGVSDVRLQGNRDRYWAYSPFGRVRSYSSTSSSLSAVNHGTTMDEAKRKREDGGGGLTDIGLRGGGDGAIDGAGEPLLVWKERIDVSIARSRKVRGGNFVQISTIDRIKMEPRCRTVVFRGFLKAAAVGGGDDGGGGGNACVMKMITDARSEKVAEVSGEAGSETHGGNDAEMVWWFGKSNEQYRIRGTLRFVGQNGLFGNGSSATTSDDDSSIGQNRNDYYLSERKQQWGNLSDSAREQFYWMDPGLDHTMQAEVPAGGRDGDGKILPPPDTFLLMLLFPARVDFLRLGDNYRQVDDLDGGGSWTSKRVNP